MTGGAADRHSAREVWRQFCRRLEQAGDIVEDAAIAEMALDQAEGYRYLSRLLRIALDMHLENADPEFPSFYQASHATAKIGADNPDNMYLNATISGLQRYRVWGKRGGAPILSFGTKANRYAADGTMHSTGELDSADMQFGPDGSFDITVSREPVAGNWLGLAEDSSFLIVRQTFLDRASEAPARVHLEALDRQHITPEPLSLARLQDGFAHALSFTEGTARTFLRWAEGFKQQQFNQLATRDQTMFWRAGGDPTIHYLHGYWRLARDEALIIHTRIPDCTFWNLQCDNIWMESLDYRFVRAHVNKHTAKLEADGTVVIAVAARDPGYGNWLDTAGHAHGTALLRWVGASEFPVPETKLVKLH